MRESRTSFAGVDTRIVETDGDGPPILFLHGFADTATTWRRVQRRLGEHGRRTLAVDQPGHGRAGRIDPDRSLLDQMVEFAADAARSLAEPVVVAGNSLGGAHALVLAARRPDLVRGVAALSPAALDHPGWMTRAAAPGPARDRMAERRPPRIVRALPPAVTGVAVSALAFGRPWRAPAAMRREWNARMTQTDLRLSLREVGRKVGDEYLTAPLPLADIACPVLALWGDRDRLTLISSRAEMEREIRDLEFVALPGVGHMPQVEVPGRTTKHLLAFADRVA